MQDYFFCGCFPQFSILRLSLNLFVIKHYTIDSSRSINMGNGLGTGFQKRKRTRILIFRKLYHSYKYVFCVKTELKVCNYVCLVLSLPLSEKPSEATPCHLVLRRATKTRTKWQSMRKHRLAWMFKKQLTCS